MITLHSIASKFIGIKEVAGAVDNPQIMAMLRMDQSWPANDEVPWCSAFVNYVAKLGGCERSKSLAARSWVNVGSFLRIEDALPGFDIVVLSRGSNPAQGHVGFFHDVTDVGVLLLGGNQGNSVSVSEFSRDRVIAVRKLRYAN